MKYPKLSKKAGLVVAGSMVAGLLVVQSSKAEFAQPESPETPVVVVEEQSPVVETQVEPTPGVTPTPEPTATPEPTVEPAPSEPVVEPSPIPLPVEEPVIEAPDFGVTNGDLYQDDGVRYEPIMVQF